MYENDFIGFLLTNTCRCKNEISTLLDFFELLSLQRQWGRNGGKCGICGDPWDGLRENEAGGRYAKGIITRNYTEGQIIDVRP